ncbi:MAG: hypothetical protein ACPG49_12275 [Chitinophagales bacterium]
MKQTQELVSREEEKQGLTDSYCLFYLSQIAPNKDSQTLNFEQLFLT